jgi:hypothetical protein
MLNANLVVVSTQNQPNHRNKVGLLISDAQLHSIGGLGDDLNSSGCLYRVIDLEESDKETIHLLVFLLMQFMSRTDLVGKTHPQKYKEVG